MSRQMTHEEIRAVVDVVDAPHLIPNKPAEVDRTFGLPVGLHTAFFGLFFAYLGVMGLGFAHPEMILPMAIFVIFTAGFYVVPMAWAVMNPEKSAKAMSMRELMVRGIETHTGLALGKDAVAQVLILPVLILGWGIAVVSIAALV
ncbi:hypothetical protein [Sphingomicrobium clamense]|uniref:Uncharacterized protein n=1 Tax=Sphingomicrobium clamense TaxID=2851013 RepID=A0ABS6V364_9SPHN|nr:hypothetical protein [Sphingomicrobium sp. B8]MBW0144003.1 hypothetical protein [Sphingomicrobium sp. B8]